MRGSPSCEITVGPSDGWRLAVAGVALAAFGTTIGWLAGAPLGQTLWARLAALVVVLGIGAVAFLLLRHRPVTLFWDGGGWRAADAAEPPLAGTPGELGVALDLGSFLLLTFTPGGDGRKGRRRWIPVGRKGRDPDWHLFRCAVYSPRPAPGSTAPERPLP